jgi:hypothetical protein
MNPPCDSEQEKIDSTKQQDKQMVSSRLEPCTSYVSLSRNGCMMACSRANDLQASGRPFRYGPMAEREGLIGCTGGGRE